MLKSVFTAALILIFVPSAQCQAQCPRTLTEAFPDPKQQKIVCELWSQNQDSAKIEMITLKASSEHAVGNIYAVVVGNGALVPTLPPSSKELSITILSGATSCKVTLQWRSQQDYVLRNKCSEQKNAMVIYSLKPVVPVD